MSKIWDSYAAEVQRHPFFNTAVEYLSTISPAQWCQAFYLLAAGCVLVVASTPAEARGLLVNYGARKATSSPLTSLPASQVKTSTSAQETNGRGHGHVPEEKTKRKTNYLVSLIAWLTSYGQVPHAWFSAFYIVSAACSLSWAAQYFRLVSLNTTTAAQNSSPNDARYAQALPLHMIASKQVALSTSTSTDDTYTAMVTVTQAQLFLAWGMMFLQASRRIYEHMTIIKPSRSTMWVVHWVLGLGFYVVTNVAVWVEGSATILNPSISINNFTSTPSTNLKILISIPLFLYAWTTQYLCHKHLANLIKYSLPDPQKAPLFKYLISPHYTCECLIYLSITIVAAPQEHYINRTLLCGLVFVIANLGVTAKGTRQWYADKFGEQAVRGKWNMIPFVF
ncbi:hypothetical protein V8F20_003752 [Naviculisporaceae sp. PSN 640]